MPYNAPQIPLEIGSVIKKLFDLNKEKNKSIWDPLNLFPDDKQRTSFITFLDTLSNRLKETSHREHILKCALIFEYVYTPGPNKLTQGSMMHKTIGQFLKLSEENQLSDKETYAFLVDFYEYVSNSVHDSEVANTVWKTKKNLLQQIHQTLESTHLKLKKEYDSALHSLPDLEVLKELVDKIITDYESINETRPDWSLFSKSKNQDRMRNLKIWRLVINTCEEMYPYQKEKLATNSADLDNWFTQKLIIASCIILIAKEIADQASRFYNGSDLFRLINCNVETLKNIKPKEQDFYLNQLHTHLTKVRIFPIFQHVKKEWKELAIDDYMKRITNAKERIKIETTDRDGIGTWVISNILGLGAGVAVLGAASLIWEVSLPTALIISLVGGGGLGSSAVRIGKSLCQSGGETAGATISRSAIRFFRKTDSANENIDVSTSVYLPEEERQIYINLLAAWLKSPDTIVPEKDKDILRKLKGIHKGHEDEELPKVKIFWGQNS